MEVKTEYSPGDFVYYWDKERQSFVGDRIRGVHIHAEYQTFSAKNPEVFYSFDADNSLSGIHIYKTKEDAIDSINFVIESIDYRDKIQLEMNNNGI